MGPPIADLARGDATVEAPPLGGHARCGRMCGPCRVDRWRRLGALARHEGRGEGQAQHSAVAATAPLARHRDKNSRRYEHQPERWLPGGPRAADRADPARVARSKIFLSRVLVHAHRPCAGAMASLLRAAPLLMGHRRRQSVPGAEQVPPSLPHPLSPPELLRSQADTLPPLGPVLHQPIFA